jgi:hypothetical protein
MFGFASRYGNPNAGMNQLFRITYRIMVSGCAWGGCLASVFAQNVSVSSIRHYEYRVVQTEEEDVQKGNIIKYYKISYNMDKQIMDSILFDDSGRMLKDVRFVYDDKGNLTEKKVFDRASRLLSSQIYRYDADGNLLTYYQTGSDTLTVIESKTYQYLPDNCCQMVHHQEGKPVQVRIYRYDKQGRMVEEQILAPNATPQYQYHYRYDDKGRLSEKLHLYQQDNLLRKYVYLRDEQGNIIQEFWYGKNDFLLFQISHTYRYDEYGNYILEKTSENGKLKSMTERSVSYFE